MLKKIRERREYRKAENYAFSWYKHHLDELLLESDTATSKRWQIAKSNKLSLDSALIAIILTGTIALGSFKGFNDSTGTPTDAINPYFYSGLDVTTSLLTAISRALNTTTYTEKELLIKENVENNRYLKAEAIKQAMNHLKKSDYENQLVAEVEHNLKREIFESHKYIFNKPVKKVVRNACKSTAQIIIVTEVLKWTGYAGGYFAGVAYNHLPAIYESVKNLF